MSHGGHGVAFLNGADADFTDGTDTAGSLRAGGAITAPRPKRIFGVVDEEEWCASDSHSERAERVEESALGGGADPSTPRCALRSG